MQRISTSDGVHLAGKSGHVCRLLELNYKICIEESALWTREMPRSFKNGFIRCTDESWENPNVHTRAGGKT